MNDLTCIYNHELKKIHKLKLFYTHIAFYLIINTILLTVNLATDPSYFWFVWPLIFWTKGLILHAFSTFDKSATVSPEHIKSKVAEEIA
jgi:hypothetical protein